MAKPTSRDEFWGKLEDIGEDEVSARLAQGTFGSDTKPLVNEWLRIKRQGRLDATSSESLRIARETLSTANDALSTAKEDLRAARSEKNATWTAAIAAIIAAAIATVSAVIALWNHS